jgi:hypothetical protein
VAQRFCVCTVILPQGLRPDAIHAQTLIVWSYA